jgi:simple sugar transport system permease protein
MIKRLQNITLSEWSILLIVLIVISVIFGLINPLFFSSTNMVNIVRTGMVNSIMAISVLLIMVAGGIDISFMAIGSVAMYSTVKFCLVYGYDAPILFIFTMAALIGLLFGLLNAVFVSKLDLPAFIVTLGTMNIIKGGMILFLGTTYIVDIPSSMASLSRTFIISAKAADGSITGLSIIVLIAVAIYLLVSFMLNYTKMGRSIYAVGGDLVAAKRAGIRTSQVLFFTYGLAGVIAAVGGVVHGTLFRTAVPGDIIGAELFVIAAVILGGAQIGKGKGTVIGTFLGVLLITIITNNLILLKVPTYYQQAVLGVLIILGTILQLQKKKKGARYETS